MKTILSRSKLEKYIKDFSLDKIFDESVIDHIELHSYQQGELVYHSQDKSGHIYVLVAGEIIVSPTSRDGKVAILKLMTPLGLLGAMEYFAKEDICHDCYSKGETKLIYITKDVLEVHLDKNIYFFKFLCEYFARSKVNTSYRQSSLLLHPLRVRLAMYLLNYEIKEGGCLIFSSSDAAKNLGVTQRHVNRVMLGFEKSNFLNKNGNSIKLNRVKMNKFIAEY